MTTRGKRQPIPTSFTVGNITIQAPSGRDALDIATQLGKAGVIALHEEDWWRLEAIKKFEAGEPLPPSPQRPTPRAIRYS